MSETHHIRSHSLIGPHTSNPAMSETRHIRSHSLIARWAGCEANEGPLRGATSVRAPTGGKMHVGYDRSMSRQGHVLVLLALALPIATAACSSGSDAARRPDRHRDARDHDQPDDHRSDHHDLDDRSADHNARPRRSLRRRGRGRLAGDAVELTDEAIQDPTRRRRRWRRRLRATSGAISTTSGPKSRSIAPTAGSHVPATTGHSSDCDHRDSSATNGDRDGSAVVQVCEIDPWNIVEPGAGPGWLGRIVNDDITRYRSTIRARADRRSMAEFGTANYWVSGPE